MIIIYDHHVSSLYIIIIYDHHILSSYVIIIYYHHILSSYNINKFLFGVSRWGHSTTWYFGCADLAGLIRDNGIIKAATGDRTLTGLGEVFYHVGWRRLDIALKYGKPQYFGRDRFRVVCQFDNLCWRSCGGQRPWHCSKLSCSRYTLTAILLVPEQDCAHVMECW